MRPGRGDITTTCVPRKRASSIEWVMKKMRFACLIPDRYEQFLHLLARQAVQGPERLVHQKHVGLGCESPGNADPLAHTARQFVGKGPRKVFETDEREKLLGAGAPQPLWNSGKLQSKRDIVDDRLPRQQRVLLEHDTAIGAGTANRSAVQCNRRLPTAAENPQSR